MVISIARKKYWYLRTIYKCRNLLINIFVDGSKAEERYFVGRKINHDHLFRILRCHTVFYHEGIVPLVVDQA